MWRRAKIFDYFWSLVEVRGPDDCWLWQGSRRVDGYGQIKFGRKMQTASRIMYILHTKEDLPSNIMVCHHCDNPPCCNPAHLFKGTAQDNCDDMIAKGRHLKKRREWLIENILPAHGLPAEIHERYRIPKN